MKKLFAVLFCTLVMIGTAFADEPSYEIDPVATAKLHWGVGAKFNTSSCWKVGYTCYSVYKGISHQGFMIMQDFYLDGKKATNPYLIRQTDPLSYSESFGTRIPSIDELYGAYKLWYPNGAKWAEIFFDDSRSGKVTVWYENGQKQEEMNFENGKEVRWRTWDEKGNLLRERDYGTPKE